MKSTYFFTIALTFLLINQSISLPRYALKTGFQCIDCHSNPTGGIIRSEEGWGYGKNLAIFSPREFEMSPYLNENISFGFDLRTQYLYSQELKKSDFHKMSGAFYTNVNLSEEINLIGKYDFIQRIWEGYGLLKIFPNNSYLKIGSFTPAFGIRLDDHTSYTQGGDFNLLFSSGTRQGMIYNPFYIETGIEAGIYFSDLAFLTMSAGQSNFPFLTDPTYTTRIEFTPQLGSINLLTGGSFGVYRDSLEVKMISGFFGFAIGELTLLGEYDVINNYMSSQTTSNAMMLEVSYKLMKSLDAVFRYDRFVPVTEKADSNFSHLIIGFEFHPFSFVEIRPQYRINLENPNSIKNDAFVLQFHFWY
ncbi:MAG: hypothetical protein FJ213_09065 [Ignavibacteria bacterium]|nr:hypothetical protein [Ignavibacteria bacterium]